VIVKGMPATDIVPPACTVTLSVAALTILPDGMVAVRVVELT
jgi:hypothetical protein